MKKNTILDRRSRTCLNHWTGDPVSHASWDTNSAMLREFCQMTVGAVDTARVSLADIFVDRFAATLTQKLILIYFAFLPYLAYYSLCRFVWQRRGIFLGGTWAKGLNLVLICFAEPRFINRETGESKRTAKVEFETAELAQKAVQARLSREVFGYVVMHCLETRLKSNCQISNI